MAIKKSELYSSLWASCDELRGGMDASQYKDYVLVMLFVKYISDKWYGQPYAPITIPDGASFKDMITLKGTTDIGDQINKKILNPIAEANKLSDMPDFNDVTKLGSGKEMVDRLTNLIAIFEKPELDFSKNKAEGDDILSKQLLRSGTSIGAMVREAEHAESKADFIHKMAIAQKEANESDYWIELLFQSEYLSENSFKSIQNDIIEINKLIASIIISAKQGKNGK